MSRSRKKRNEKSPVNLQNDQSMFSLSKYFFPSSTSQANPRKRLSTFVKDASPEKVRKLEEPPDLEFKSSSSKCTDLDRNLEPSSDIPSQLSGVSEMSKSKLSHFAYSKHLKLPEKTALKLSKLIECEKTTNVESLSFEEMDASENPSLENMNFSITPAPKKFKYTPLEMQYLDFQAKYPGAVLLIECGYKYRFFGKDAEIASKDLNIGCYQYHNFLSASIPVHRLHYHVRRLVLKGHKVGIIKQTESAALKAVGETRNELFTRELHTMYSKSTFIEEELSNLRDENSIQVDNINDTDAVSGYLICINEKRISNKESSGINIACVALQVSSGDIFYSSFHDSLVQNELENYLLYINPSEILLPSSLLSKKSEVLVKSFSCDRSSRIERLDDKVFEHSFALSTISSFISVEEDTQNLQMLLSLPPLVVSCLSALKTYLSEFKVENILKSIKNMKPFSTNECMILNAATLRSLEILCSNSNISNCGTLFSCMNQTLTKFGERLLKSWIVKPLKDAEKIEERLNIVAEIIHSDSMIFKKISSLLYKLPDLERLLCSVFYHKCSCYDFLNLVKALITLKEELFGLTDRINSEVEALKLRNNLYGIVKYLNGIERFNSNIDPDAAKEGNKVRLFLDTTKYINMEACKFKISNIEKMLNDLRPSICTILRLPAMKYATVAGQKFLIEVPNSHLSLVPDNWLKISMTKQVSRFRSPEIIEMCKEMDQEQEKLLRFANEAWEEFLNEFGKEFYKYKHAVSYLAELDVYMAFAKISKDEQYCRPLLINSGIRKFDIKQGRHPVVMKLMGEENQFVSNDVSLNGTKRCLIVTGPNMGGKSTYIRQMALIALITHMGCFVPANSATVPLFDGIYVRMGADDDIINKNSTFMTEMNEASSILSSATSKSLVIFDELGRGTSTNDGTAIAFATLEYLIKKIQCFTLFVTHYPTVLELRNYYPEHISDVHMAYILKEIDDDDIQTVTFLYNAISGVSEKSYGINVAALAGISKDILIEAQKKSKEMELRMIVQRQLRNLLQYFESQNPKNENTECSSASQLI